MGFQPERASADGWINTDLVPPSRLIATAMDLAMMSPAEGYDKLVANFAAKGRRLRNAQMMGIGGTAAADEARLLGN
jgi:hypothetical protein